MTYVVDFNKSGDELLLDLVNHDNRTSFKYEDLIMVKPPTVLEDDIRNTQTAIQTKDPDVDIKEVLVKYNRIDIGMLFSVVGCRVRELTIDYVNDVPQLNNKFFDSIKQRYGLTMLPEDFTITRGSKGTIRITANEGSLTYIGSTIVEIIPSLETRIPNTQLDGFKIGYYGEQWVIAPTEIYPRHSVFYASHPAAAPQQHFGGEWEPVTTHVLSGDQMFYHNHPIGYAVELIGADIPKSDAYTYVALHNDEAYNEGVAVKVEGKPQLEIVDESSPLYGQIVDIVNPVSGSRTFMMVSKRPGRVTDKDDPIYAWRRLD